VHYILTVEVNLESLNVSSLYLLLYISGKRTNIISWMGYISIIWKWVPNCNKIRPHHYLLLYPCYSGAWHRIHHRNKDDRNFAWHLRRAWWLWVRESTNVSSLTHTYTLYIIHSLLLKSSLTYSNYTTIYNLHLHIPSVSFSRNTLV